MLNLGPIGAKLAAASTVRLNPLTPVKAASGAYTISFIALPPTPPGGKTFLCLEDADNRLDITGGYNSSKLPALLELVRGIDAWGKTVKSWGVVTQQNGTQVVETPAQDFACPVKPFDGPFTFDGFRSNVPPLTYPGNGHGRTLTHINGRYYFYNAGLLETDNAKRGFDCTTFPMALFRTSVNMTGKYGTALAVALGATPCDMEQKKTADVKAFFADARKGALGLYFMWSAGHVVLVKDATIHEFTYGGYNRTPAASWGGYKFAAQGLWWVRKLPATLNP
jgi:hypothetical protein